MPDWRIQVSEEEAQAYSARLREEEDARQAEEAIRQAEAQAAQPVEETPPPTQQTPPVPTIPQNNGIPSVRPIFQVIQGGPEVESLRPYRETRDLIVRMWAGWKYLIEPHDNDLNLVYVRLRKPGQPVRNGFLNERLESFLMIPILYQARYGGGLLIPARNRIPMLRISLESFSQYLMDLGIGPDVPVDQAPPVDPQTRQCENSPPHVNQQPREETEFSEGMAYRASMHGASLEALRYVWRHWKFSRSTSEDPTLVRFRLISPDMSQLDYFQNGRLFRDLANIYGQTFLRGNRAENRNDVISNVLLLSGDMAENRNDVISNVLLVPSGDADRFSRYLSMIGFVESHGEMVLRNLSNSENRGREWAGWEFMLSPVSNSAAEFNLLFKFGGIPYFPDTFWESRQCVFDTLSQLLSVPSSSFNGSGFRIPDTRVDDVRSTLIDLGLVEVPFRVELLEPDGLQRLRTFWQRWEFQLSTEGVFRFVPPNALGVPESIEFTGQESEFFQSLLESFGITVEPSNWSAEHNRFMVCTSARRVNGILPRDRDEAFVIHLRTCGFQPME